MAWYRAGGGGIPSSLKSDMNDVLNKKFGTSQDYPPTDWAPTVNLMGPLPEKTVSGAIVTFSDGADGVPLKKCEITLPASLDGYSSVDVVHTGKNLVDGTDFTQGLPSTTIGASIETISASTRYAYFGTPIKGGNYNISSVSNDSDYYNAILIFGYSGGFLTVYTGGTVNGNKTVDFSGCDYVRVVIGTRTVAYQVPTDFTEYGTIQMEYGAFTSYEPYTAPTTHTATLGRTIYGGTADVVKGSAYSKNLLENTLTTQTVNGTTFTVNADKSITVSGTPSTQTRVYIHSGEFYEVVETGVFSSGSMPNGTRIFCQKVTSGGTTSYPTISQTATLNEVGSKYSNMLLEIGTSFDGTEFTIYPMLEIGSTPTAYSPYFEAFTFDPVPIDSKLGNNTLWSEQGSSVEVTYRADIDLALGGN